MEKLPPDDQIRRMAERVFGGITGQHSSDRDSRTRDNSNPVPGSRVLPDGKVLHGVDPGVRGYEGPLSSNASYDHGPVIAARPHAKRKRRT